MNGMDPNILQYLARMQPQMGLLSAPPPPPAYQPPQIDQTPGIYNQTAHSRAMMPLPPMPVGDKNTPAQATDLSQPPSQASQWASQGLFGSMPGANGQQQGLGQGMLLNLLKMFGVGA